MKVTVEKSRARFVGSSNCHNTAQLFQSASGYIGISRRIGYSVLFLQDQIEMEFPLSVKYDTLILKLLDILRESIPLYSMKHKIVEKDLTNRMDIIMFINSHDWHCGISYEREREKLKTYLFFYKHMFSLKE